MVRPASLVPEATGLGGGYFLTDYLGRHSSWSRTVVKPEGDKEVIFN